MSGVTGIVALRTNKTSKSSAGSWEFEALFSVPGFQLTGTDPI